MRFYSMLRFVIVVATITLLAMGVFARRGWVDWQRMVRQDEQLLQKLESTRVEKAHWETRLKGLKSNKRAQERVVRQILGFVKKDEVVIEF